METRKIKTLLIIVDIQNDFVKKDGALAIDVPEAYLPMLKMKRSKLLEMLTKAYLDICYTMDWHDMSDKEISVTPDWKTTYPPHCMKNTKGAELAINPGDDAVVVKHDEDFDFSKYQHTNTPFIFQKNTINVFDNPNFLKFLKQNKAGYASVLLMGVATNICVFEIVKELNKHKISPLVSILNHETYGVW